MNHYGINIIIIEMMSNIIINNVLFVNKSDNNKSLIKILIFARKNFLTAFYLCNKIIISLEINKS